jgi:hypothetical protein
MSDNSLLRPNFKKIPDKLKERPQWVVWKLVPDTDKDGNPKPRKTPVDPKTGRNAKANDPSTWGTYYEALEFYTRHLNDVAGVGYEFSANDPYVGIDLDKAIKGNEPLPWAMKIIMELDSYTEFSPSMTGYHIIVRGELPPGRRKNGQVEMYQDGRFFTMTGKWFSNNFRTIEDRGEQLKKVYSRVFPSNGKNPQNRPSEAASMGSATLMRPSFWNALQRQETGLCFHACGPGTSPGMAPTPMRTLPCATSLPSGQEEIRRLWIPSSDDPDSCGTSGTRFIVRRTAQPSAK